MKKYLLTFLAPTLFLLSTALPYKQSETKEYARCMGYTPCKACSNCSQCNYCNSGGSCGKCEKKYSMPLKASAKKSTPYSGRCKAITKKGTQCSRSAGSSGYCWQHGE